MSALSYESPASDEHELLGMQSFVTYPLRFSSSGPSAEEVPLPRLYARQSADAVEHRNDEEQVVVAPFRWRNPMPTSGSRRDSSGVWSVGSAGHDLGRCLGPCKDLRSGRGCSWGAHCNRCHCPHPEVSSTSIRSRGVRARANRLMEDRPRGLDFGQVQRMEYQRNAREFVPVRPGPSSSTSIESQRPDMSQFCQDCFVAFSNEMLDEKSFEKSHHRNVYYARGVSFKRAARMSCVATWGALLTA
eukprot:TRINITY_DN4261_c0_g1_i2.p1 TRINITY_DN4261_c0_g1~~TRINITY_DN4261_c0_g1_i2.p1  ORF type:complete len:245 (+),score=0.87 TRINITY_DN4261_c0_g1_i2:54-788(+)